MAGGLSALTFSALSTRAADRGDWPTAPPESQGFHRAALDSLLDATRILDVSTSLYALRCVVVVRNGFLIDERYYDRTKVSTLRGVASITKSVASILVGIAMEQGKIGGLDQTVGELLPDAVAKAPNSTLNGVTLRQILTHTTGLPNDRQSGFVALDPVSQVQLLMQLSPPEPNSTPVWRYSSAGASLISPILARAVGGSVEGFARRVLFSPLGIDDYDWARDSMGNVRTDAGLRFCARDVAKLAWMMADGGRWREGQVVPARWVDESTRARIPASVQVSPIADINYGYFWYTGTMRNRAVVWAWGYGAQFAVIVPSLNLVVVTLADRPSAKELGKQNAEIMGLVAQIADLAG